MPLMESAQIFHFWFFLSSKMRQKNSIKAANIIRSHHRSEFHLNSSLDICNCFLVSDPTCLCLTVQLLVQIKMFQSLWLWRQEYQHHEQLPLAFNGTWPSWNSDLDNRPW